MTDTEEVMRALGRVEATTKATAEDVRYVKRMVVGYSERLRNQEVAMAKHVARHRQTGVIARIGAACVVVVGALTAAWDRFG
jgi:hypothetical protein|tara:strand:+ start:24718 stop:24963 length:246 start_codon:yes stop_codon:yes gene_type:complete